MYIKDGMCWISYTGPAGRVRQSTGLPDTTKNRKAAADIVAALRLNGAGHRQEPPKFGHYASEWLDGQDHLAKATWEEYRKILNAYWLPSLHGKPLDRITGTDLASIAAGIPWQSAKTRNNAVSVIRRVFDSAFRDGWIQTDPSVRLRFAKVQKPEPDPMTINEVESVLAWMTRHPVWHSYTATVRRVELNTRSLAAIRRQKERTFLAGGIVFLHPETGKQINDDKPPRLTWTSALKALDIRHRDAYQTRHTFATLCLMAGANPAWIARQLGHANMGMLLTRYGRWIDSADGGTELGKLEQSIKKIV